MSYSEYHQAVERLNATINRSANYMKSADGSINQQFFLDRTQGLLDALGNPEKSGFQVIHIAGTSGKGSTSTMIYEALVAAGLDAGLFMSPYVTTAIENIHVHGKLVDPSVFAAVVHEVVDVAEKIEKQQPEMMPSYSEIFFAVALRVFQASGVEWAVLETGCGGRFDYTRAMPNNAVVAAVLTPISIDHTAVLGDTIEQIAWHKAGIIRRGAAAFSADQLPAARAIIEQEATEQHVVVQYVADNDVFNGALTMPGTHQQHNAALAAAVCRFLQLPQDAIEHGLSHSRLPARVETMQYADASTNAPLVILDGAHSPAKIQALVHTLQHIHAEHEANGTAWKKTHLLFAAKESKELDELLKPLLPLVDTVTLTSWQLPGFGSCTPEETAAVVKQLQPNLPCNIVSSAPAALHEVLHQASSEDFVLITGSLYLAGILRAHWISEEEVLQHRSVFLKHS